MDTNFPVSWVHVAKVLLYFTLLQISLFLGIVERNLKLINIRKATASQFSAKKHYNIAAIAYMGVIALYRVDNSSLIATKIAIAAMYIVFVFWRKTKQTYNYYL